MALALWLFVNLSSGEPQPRQLTFAQLEQIAEEGGVESAVFREADQVIEGELTGGEPYTAKYPLDYQDELIANLQTAEVRLSADPQIGSTFVTVLINILP
ncbi:MAG TPA: ATP-dependent metallopeptidase FtsH/Yme1/Tma family protein, partial [Actinomycetota bacterium]|nr:ATP-dependent metallopeptidase FtsH/Yme1/Tma family protein [Actinomycetota bacterium]